MDDLVHSFDDLELQNPSETRGKEPAPFDDEDIYGGTLDRENSEPDDLTCAICLGTIPLEELAMIKGCDHIYCAHCILLWAIHKEKPCCPQCKNHFSHLLTYRALDGSLNDFPVEESVTLLKRARWFEDHVKELPHEERNENNSLSARHLLEESLAADALAWHDYADELDLAEDDVIEDFYFSSAAGKARVTFGNRRFGEGGFITSGRRRARPKPPKAKNASTSFKVPGNRSGMSSQGEKDVDYNNKNRGGESSSCPSSAALLSQGRHSHSSEGGSRVQTPPGSSPGLYGSSPSGSGRRARRNAKRAAAMT